MFDFSVGLNDLRLEEIVKLLRDGSLLVVVGILNILLNRKQ